MYIHSEKLAKFTAWKTYPFTRVDKLKAIVDQGWEPWVMEQKLVANAVSTKVCYDLSLETGMQRRDSERLS